MHKDAIRRRSDRSIDARPMLPRDLVVVHRLDSIYERYDLGRFNHVLP